MRLLRRLSQIVFFCVFIVLLVKTTWPLHSPVPVHAFLSLDPLAALAVLLSPARSWWGLHLFAAAVLLLVVTALLGRFFCGWVCPLGTCIDGADKATGALRRRGDAAAPNPSTNTRVRQVKYLLLAVVLVAGLFGVHLFWLLDPLVLLTRTFATVLLPAGAVLWNAALPWLSASGVRVPPQPVHHYALVWPTALFFLAILLLGLWGRRFWCRNLCPLGALLALVGRFGLWRRQVSDHCHECRRCARDCKMEAIPATKPQRTLQAECIQCYNCLGGCQPAATRLVLAPTTQTSPQVDLGRREFLAACATGVAYGALAHYGLSREPRSSRLLRPPGALVRDASGRLAGRLSEDEFLSKCLRCGQCMKACLTGGLQPAVGEAGLLGLFTPRLVPRIGQCEQGCAACGSVCPSGALVPFTVAEKPWIRLGEARIAHKTCFCWQAGDDYRECLVCAEHCGYGAIEVVEVAGQRRPVVRHGRCTGCGLCEKVCPAHHGAAIVVYSRGERRGGPHREGSQYAS